jgi:hypothetical protein
LLSSEELQSKQRSKEVDPSVDEANAPVTLKRMYRRGPSEGEESTTFNSITSNAFRVDSNFLACAIPPSLSGVATINSWIAKMASFLERAPIEAALKISGPDFPVTSKVEEPPLDLTTKALTPSKTARGKSRTNFGGRSLETDKAPPTAAVITATLAATPVAHGQDEPSPGQP